MADSETYDLKSYIKPIYFVNKVISFWYFDFGVNPFERLILKILNLCFIFLLLFCMYKQVLVLFISVKLINSTLFAHHANEMRHIFGYCTILGVFINNFVKRKEMGKIFEQMFIFDFKHVRFRAKRKNIKSVILLFILINYCIVVFDSYTFSNYLTHFQFKNYIYSIIPCALHLFNILNCDAIMFILKNMFKKINQNIISITNSFQKNIKFDNVKKQMYLRQIFQICNIHLELSGISKSQNNFYEIPQIIFTSYAFIGFVINYNYLRITMYPIIVEKEDAGLLALNDLLWCAYYCVMIQWMLGPWCKLENEVRLVA